MTTPTSRPGKLQQALYGNKHIIKPQKALVKENVSPGASGEVMTTMPSTTMFVVVRVSPDGLGAPAGVYSDSTKANAARDMVDPAQVYELMLDAPPEE